MKKSFEELGIANEILMALNKKGFKEPTDIQEKVIPELLARSGNLIGQAQTGTGKTGAFAIPLIQNLESKGTVQAIILTPTRELALQVAREIDSLKGSKNLKVLTVYGGQPIEKQLRKLKEGVDIVVGTPGRVLDHIRRGTLDLSKIEYFILDEADEMLNMGFIDDIETIMKETPRNKTTLLFSATMPKEILRIARKYMKDYKFISVIKEQLASINVEQFYVEVPYRKKFSALKKLLTNDFYGIIFTRTKREADMLAKRLQQKGYKAEAMHGDKTQRRRENILKSFKNKRIRILVATDVAARGIDVSNLTHIINYSLPQDPEYYVHRIGRTGRAGKKGTAVTIITPEEYNDLRRVMAVSKSDIKKQKISVHSTEEKEKPTKLIISLGYMQGIDKQGILDFLSSYNISPDDISDIEVFANRSFITAPFSKANYILSKFRGKESSSVPLVKKAKRHKSKQKRSFKNK